MSYRAPRITYAPDSGPTARLVELLRKLELAPEEVLPADADAQNRARLAAYWRARDRFIEVGQSMRPTSDPHHMLLQVREPLLQVLQLCPEFRPAYDPLLRLSAALAKSDPATAQRLLADLMQAQPDRLEAAEAFRALATAQR